MKCPECAKHGVETECEPFAEVDIGVGVQTGGPWGCPVCHWVEEGMEGLRPMNDNEDFEEF
jgi:hypothetical protein